MKDDIVKNVLVFYFPYNENQRDQMLNEHNTFKKKKIVVKMVKNV